MAGLGLLCLVFTLPADAWTQARASVTPETSVKQHRVRVRGASGQRADVLVTWVKRGDGRDAPPGHRRAIVVALHGYGEAKKGPRRGFLGWTRDYHLPAAYGALARGPMTMSAYGGLVTPSHLALVNREMTSPQATEVGRNGGPNATGPNATEVDLEARVHPATEVAVVTPYAPPDLSGQPPDHPRVAAYLDWLAGDLLAQLRTRFPHLARGRASTGIDGVSFGGWLALEAGLRYPRVFASVGGIQPAIRGKTRRLAEQARRNDRAGLGQHLRVLTGDRDILRPVAVRFSEALEAQDVAHTLLSMPGGHGYAFNRGPGVIELLRFHGGVLPLETNAIRSSVE